MHLERFFDRVKNSPDWLRRRVAGERFDVAFREQINVQFGPDPRQRLGQPQRRGIAAFGFAERVQHRPEDRRIVARPVGEALSQDDGAEAGLIAVAQNASSNDPTKTGS